MWHLAAVSVVKCTVIVRPLTHFTIFTDRALRSVICVIWTWSLLVAVVANLGVTEAQFNWTTMIVLRQRWGFEDTVFEVKDKAKDLDMEPAGGRRR